MSPSTTPPTRGPMNPVKVQLVVRFTESQRYCIYRDCDVVQFIALTDRGSFHAEAPVGGHKSLRENRARFKQLVIDAMLEGRDPCKLDLTEPAHA